jgi:hypothetical protein
VHDKIKERKTRWVVVELLARCKKCRMQMRSLAEGRKYRLFFFLFLIRGEKKKGKDKKKVEKRKGWATTTTATPRSSMSVTKHQLDNSHPGEGREENIRKKKDARRSDVRMEVRAMLW